MYSYCFRCLAIYLLGLPIQSFYGVNCVSWMQALKNGVLWSVLFHIYHCIPDCEGGASYYLTNSLNPKKVVCCVPAPTPTKSLAYKS